MPTTPSSSRTPVEPSDAWRSPKRPDAPIELFLGAMNFGKRTPEKDALSIVDRALDLGITMLDTANAYASGESERIVGRAIRGRRDQFTITTKVGFDRVGAKAEGLSHAAVIRACDESRKRLGTDVIDLYYLHVPDHATPIDETLGALHELVEKQRILAWGVSNYASWQMLDMMIRCDRIGLMRPSHGQMLYNLLLRELDVEYFAFSRSNAVHTSVYNPLAGGLLTGKHSLAAPPERGSRFDAIEMYRRRYFTPPMFALVDRYKALASERGMSLIELSYAWLASHASVDSILVGPVTLLHLDAAAAACAKRLDDVSMKAVDDAYREHVGTDAHYVR